MISPPSSLAHMTHQSQPQLLPKQADEFGAFCTKHLEAILGFVREHCQAGTPTCDANLLAGFFKLLEASLAPERRAASRGEHLNNVKNFSQQ